MDTQANNSLIKVEEFNQIMQSAPATLQRNQASVSACNQTGQALLDTIEAEEGISSDELDATVSEYLEKTKITVENMNKRRKPLTQLLATVSKSFTSLESAIDIKSVTTIPYKLQQARNKYAAKKLEEQKKREAEARRIQLTENEKAQYKADITLLLDTTYANYVSRHIKALSGMYDHATLASYNDVCRQIKEANVTFNWTDFANNVKDTFQTFYMDAATRTGIKNELASIKKVEYTKRYSFELEDLKQSLIDRLPSLRKQLEEQEELRRTNAVEAARQEEQRRKEQQEQLRKQEEERKRREAEAKAKAEAEKAAAEVQAAFDFSAASMPSTPTKAKVKKKIQITNPQGFLQVYQMWFTREGINMSMEDLEKVHKKMITYCEKVVNKDGEEIKSAFVKYIDDVTAK
ncbi:MULTISPECIES: hypothetical protein [Parabacteroides]|uniref:DUF1351 domain-containing protein n=1 Tax=Parabacteroides goldsteinii dnLKV18 TaxID=1235789 RepID=S0GT44_9BACT|nr:MULTISPECIES: hypothetical protein [Parabacteroides]EOS18580.1 hypothetical protein C803_01577 [Parabacteroides goldsteinii dnLKV18]KAI4361755.1 hypothetical protein C825_003824 [Parabacteroides sp. ASF519]MBF0763507.1 hypothetical protein [Parabacteroides goldsteinii]MDZ3925092.1 hypothetical protein [Parabacteroides goldsteinii]NBI94749.1 hypothetical protein [Parabacteroides goldsteinii]